ncbi:MAG: hypothetical protein OXU20_34735 [Myxococcales bacterium]|nr:hypothetical protein [Myxococcales bacterium]
MSLVGLGYLTSFAALSPLSLLGYATHAPIVAFSAAIASAVGAGAAYWMWIVVRYRERFHLPSALRNADTWAGGLVIALLAVDMAAAFNHGGHQGGDAVYHIARIRHLVDHGFNNWDIFFRERYFARIYHTNLYHALLAGAVKLTGQQEYVVWLCTHAWAKLACASAMYHLGWVVFQRRALSWCAAAAVIISYITKDLLLYPNQIGYAWLGVLTLAAGVHYAMEPDSWRAVAAVAMTSWVTAQVHALYALFGAMMAAPVLVVALARNLHRTRSARRVLKPLLALVGLGLCLPFVAIAAREPAEPAGRPLPAVHPLDGLGADELLALGVRGKDARIQREKNPGGKLDKPRRQVLPAPPASRYITEVGNRRVVKSKGRFRIPDSNGFLTIVMLLAGLLLRRQAQFGYLLVALGALCMYMFFPPLSELLIARTGGSGWIMGRMPAYIGPFTLLCMPAALLFWLPRSLDRWLAPLLVAGAIAVNWGPPGRKRSNRNFEQLGRASLVGAAGTKARRQHGEHARRLAELMQAGSVVIARDKAIPFLATHHDLFFVAAADRRTAPGISNKRRRQDDQRIMMQRRADVRTRAKLMQYYDVRYVHMHHNGKRDRMRRRLKRRFGPFMRRLAQLGNETVVELDPKKVRLIAEKGESKEP